MAGRTIGLGTLARGRLGTRLEGERVVEEGMAGFGGRVSMGEILKKVAAL